jgi:hypothetical protein
VLATKNAAGMVTDVFVLLLNMIHVKMFSVNLTKYVMFLLVELLIALTHAKIMDPVQVTLYAVLLISAAQMDQSIVQI